MLGRFAFLGPLLLPFTHYVMAPGLSYRVIFRLQNGEDGSNGSRLNIAGFVTVGKVSINDDNHDGNRLRMQG